MNEQNYNVWDVIEEKNKKSRVKAAENYGMEFGTYEDRYESILTLWQVNGKAFDPNDKKGLEIAQKLVGALDMPKSTRIEYISQPSKIERTQDLIQVNPEYRINITT